MFRLDLRFTSAYSRLTVLEKKEVSRSSAPVLPRVPESEKQVLAACEQALRLAPPEWPTTLPASEELHGAPQWYPFETDTWNIGESIRQWQTLTIERQITAPQGQLNQVLVFKREETSKNDSQ